MQFWRLAICAAAATGVLSISATATAAPGSKRVAPGGGYCITYKGLEPRSGYYYATWQNNCDYDIDVEYSRVKPENGQQVWERISIPALGTRSENMYASPSISWAEAF